MGLGRYGHRIEIGRGHIGRNPGVLRGDNREARSPRNLATSDDRGTPYSIGDKNLDEAKALVEAWRKIHDRIRLQSTLGDLTPQQLVDKFGSS